jgi:hypothetical protein
MARRGRQVRSLFLEAGYEAVKEGWVYSPFLGLDAACGEQKQEKSDLLDTIIHFVCPVTVEERILRLRKGSLAPGLMEVQAKTPKQVRPGGFPGNA